jgi:tRNA G26 N,N-dimethylase Trm1
MAATKSNTKQQISTALFVARNDAEYVLEPLVDSLLSNGLTQAEVLDAVAASAKRALRVSVSDSNFKLSVAEWDAEAQRVAKKLIERLTVTDPDAVPPVSQRRGLPAAVAARLA